MDARIEHISTSAYAIPTDAPESDGTLQWDSTTIVLVEVRAGGKTGLGHTYAAAATAQLIPEKLRDVVLGQDTMAVTGVWADMQRVIRNLGRPGIAATAIAAVDCALWDLKAKLLHLPLVRLLGPVRASIPVYGSGGFTSYSIDQLQEQFREWGNAGITRMKMKIGRHADRDIPRVRAAREAIGPDPDLMVDANGACDRKQALELAEALVDWGVTWFEEPVSSDDLEGLRLLRDRAPAGMEIAAGEYGYDSFYFRRMLQAGAVDVLQADGTRCGGITGFLQADALCSAHTVPLSAHTAPSFHAHVCCAAPSARDIEYFHDHARIERMLFEGALEPVGGELRPDLSRPGLGLEFKRSDAEHFLVWES